MSDVVLVGPEPQQPAYLTAQSEPAVVLASQVGQPGPRGPDGHGVGKRWHGEGPPGVVVGAAPDDEYLDVLTLTLYYLR